MPFFDCGIHRVQADGVSWFLDHTFDRFHIACRRKDDNLSRFPGDKDDFVPGIEIQCFSYFSGYRDLPLVVICPVSSADFRVMAAKIRANLQFNCRLAQKNTKLSNYV